MGDLRGVSTTCPVCGHDYDCPRHRNRCTNSPDIPSDGLSGPERLREYHLICYAIGAGPKPPALEVYEEYYENLES